MSRRVARLTTESYKVWTLKARQKEKYAILSGEKCAKVAV